MMLSSAWRENQVAGRSRFPCHKLTAGDPAQDGAPDHPGHDAPPRQVEPHDLVGAAVGAEIEQASETALPGPVGHPALGMLVGELADHPPGLVEVTKRPVAVPEHRVELQVRHAEAPGSSASQRRLARA